MGSNLGDRWANLRSGVRRLPGPGLEVAGLSSVWETAPVDGAGPDWFLNLVARIETVLEPRALLERLLGFERQAGRVRTRRNAPRVLDLDLLLLGTLECEEPGLTLPHPRLWDRRFVLAPLAELAPDLRNPRTGRTVVEEERALRQWQPDVIGRGPLALPGRQLL